MRQPYLIDREAELLKQRRVVVKLVRRARNRLDHPFEHIVLIFLASLEHHVENQHEVEKDAPHVGVTIALATNSELQERGAVLNRLTVKLVVDRNRAEVWRKR